MRVALHSSRGVLAPTRSLPHRRRRCAAPRSQRLHFLAPPSRTSNEAAFIAARPRQSLRASLYFVVAKVFAPQALAHIAPPPRFPFNRSQNAPVTRVEHSTPSPPTAGSLKLLKRAEGKEEEPHPHE